MNDNHLTDERQCEDNSVGMEEYMAALDWQLDEWHEEQIEDVNAELQCLAS